MIMEEEALRHRIRTDIITSQKQLDTLCLELVLEPYKVSLSLNVFTNNERATSLLDMLYRNLSQLEEGLTVLQMEKNLRCRVESLQKERNERMSELNDLTKQDEELCVTLCATPYYIPTGSVPSRSQLQELQEHVEMLNKEKVSAIANTRECLP